jgi:hypothetical protein
MKNPDNRPSVGDVAARIFRAGSMTVEIPGRRADEPLNPLHGQTVRLTAEVNNGAHAITLEHIQDGQASVLGGSVARTRADSLTALLLGRPVLGETLFDRTRRAR